MARCMYLINEMLVTVARKPRGELSLKCGGLSLKYILSSNWAFCHTVGLEQFDCKQPVVF